MLTLLTIPGLRGLFQLAAPSPLGWALIGGSALLAPLVARLPLPNLFVADTDQGTIQ